MPAGPLFMRFLWVVQWYVPWLSSSLNYQQRRLSLPQACVYFKLGLYSSSRALIMAVCSAGKSKIHHNCSSAIRIAQTCIRWVSNCMHTRVRTYAMSAWVSELTFCMTLSYCLNKNTKLGWTSSWNASQPMHLSLQQPWECLWISNISMTMSPNSCKGDLSRCTLIAVCVWTTSRWSQEVIATTARQSGSS